MFQYKHKLLWKTLSLHILASIPPATVGSTILPWKALKIDYTCRYIEFFLKLSYKHYKEAEKKPSNWESSLVLLL